MRQFMTTPIATANLVLDLGGTSVVPMILFVSFTVGDRNESSLEGSTFGDQVNLSQCSIFNCASSPFHQLYSGKVVDPQPIELDSLTVYKDTGTDTSPLFRRIRSFKTHSQPLLPHSIQQLQISILSTASTPTITRSTSRGKQGETFRLHCN